MSKKFSGRFSITSVGDEEFYADFFSRELKIWNKESYFVANGSVAVIVKAWMESEVADPEKHLNE